MSATQSSVTTRDAGFPGLLADTADNYTVPFTVEGTAEVPFGTLVIQGTGQDQAKRPAAQADTAYAKNIGIVVHSHAYGKPYELGVLGLTQYTVGKALREGRIKVWSSEAVSPTDAVRVRADNNAGTDEKLGPGTFCKSAAAGHTVAISKGARWTETITAPGIVELEIDVLAFTLAND